MSWGFLRGQGRVRNISEREGGMHGWPASSKGVSMEVRSQHV